MIVGDRVEWVSQLAIGQKGGGKNGVRTGTIQEVVPRGRDPRTMKAQLAAKVRDHESYVIKEDVTGKCFWPRAAVVKRVASDTIDEK